ncbi:hypothetical protein BJ508DRAFT_64347 [Ascobolus immersus RN42]|uniref:Mid2 domain-containing protein n=1 Tax=Ascobolus immersus RN42 TaxID=1160509 RepID=A0A3N4IU55_ASCIM|nr:hypothetical protein BJ508DRAFT_64347 [Ascobolus immersus RN42]
MGVVKVTTFEFAFFFSCCLLCVIFPQPVGSQGNAFFITPTATSVFYYREDASYLVSWNRDLVSAEDKRKATKMTLVYLGPPEASIDLTWDDNIRLADYSSVKFQLTSQKLRLFGVKPGQSFKAKLRYLVQLNEDDPLSYSLLHESEAFMINIAWDQSGLGSETDTTPTPTASRAVPPASVPPGKGSTAETRQSKPSPKTLAGAIGGSLAGVCIILAVAIVILRKRRQERHAVDTPSKAEQPHTTEVISELDAGTNLDDRRTAMP